MFEIKKVKDIGYAGGEASKLLLDLYLPVGDGPYPLLVFFYGGGLEAGAKEDVASQAEEFAGEGIAVAVPNYRLFPQVSYPAFIEDAAKSVAWVKNHMNGYLPCREIFIGGHSAGAYLAMMLCFDKSYLARHGVDADEMAGYIFCSGQPTTHFNVLKYRGADERQVMIDVAAPIYHIRSHGAPMQVICGERDMENRLEQTQLLVSTLRHFRYDEDVDFRLLDNCDHVNYIQRETQEHSRLYQVASDFIRKHSKY